MIIETGEYSVKRSTRRDWSANIVIVEGFYMPAWGWRDITEYVVTWACDADGGPDEPPIGGSAVPDGAVFVAHDEMLNYSDLYGYYAEKWELKGDWMPQEDPEEEAE